MLVMDSNGVSHVSYKAYLVFSTIVVADHVSNIQANSLEFHVQFGPPAMQLGPENPPKRTDISGRPFFAETQISDDNYTDQLSNITSHHQLTNSFHGKDMFQKRDSILTRVNYLA